MKNKTTKTIEKKYTYVQIPRTWISDYMSREITCDEFFVLMWLTLRANYYSGKYATTYEVIASELSGKYETNRINKIMLSLKSKQRIWYPEIKGSRRPFEVEIEGYPILGKTAKDITHRFNTDDRDYKEPEQKLERAESEDLQTQDNDIADNDANKQRSEKELDEPLLENLWV